MLFRSVSQSRYAAQQMRIHNRLLAYVAEFDKDWKVDLTNGANQHKYFIYFDYATNEYRTSSYTTSSPIGIVYMSRECATELCRKLNSGEVVL